MTLPTTYRYYLAAVPGEDAGGERPPAVPIGLGPGGLHFQVDERTVAVWHFDEQDDVPPSDRAHNVDDLVPPAGMTRPTRAEGIVGWARQWAAGQGLQGAELVEDVTRLRRSMSIEALVLPVGDGERCLIQRGAGDGTPAERILWGLRLETAAGVGTLQMYWQRSSGASAGVPGVTFPLPAGWLLLAAVRRWASEIEVAIDYYVNGVPVGTTTSGDGDIDDGDDGTTLVGLCTEAGGGEPAPIVVPAGGWDFHVETSGGANAATLNVAPDTYTVAELLTAVEDELNAWLTGWDPGHAPFYVELIEAGQWADNEFLQEVPPQDAVGHVVIWSGTVRDSTASIVMSELVWTDTDLRDALGYEDDGAFEGDDGFAATNAPSAVGGTLASGMLPGDRIDEIRVSNAPRTAEELRHVFRRLFVYTVWARDLMRQLLPPEVYSTDQSSMVQRAIAVDADALATAWALAGELGDDFLPDRATRALDRWEAVTRQPAGPADTIYRRRDRVLAHLRKIHGYSRAKIAETLAPILGIAAEDVVFIEYSNRFADDFGAGAIGSTWREEPNAGTIAQATGALTLAFQAGDDARWTGAVELPVRLRRGLDAYEEVEIRAALTAHTLTNTGDFAGVFVLHPAGDYHLWGVRWSGSALEWAQRAEIAGVDALTIYPSPAVPGGTIYLRLRLLATGGAALQFSTVGWEGPWTTVASPVPTPPAGYWTGLFLAGGDAGPATGSSAVFTEARLWMPRSRQVFQWYVSNLGLPATADLRAAQSMIEDMKPAHTRGRMKGTAFLCDDPDSLCDTPGDVLGV